MATKKLSAPKLAIKLNSGTSKVEVSASVHVKLDEVDMNAIKLLGLKFRVKCMLQGSDSGLNGDDDILFPIPSKLITSSGTVPFTKTVERSELDEDWESDDEVYAHFTLESISPLFPYKEEKDSPIITGSF